MAVQINAASAGIDVIAGQAVPAIALIPGLGGPVAVCNLTRNFNPDPTRVDWAFDLLGHVKVALAPGDSLAGHTFGFVQYIRHKVAGAFYAGRRRQEGSIGLNWAPLIGTDYMLDCSPSTTRPFMWPPARFFSFVDDEADAKMGDHPVLSLMQRQFNVTTGQDNFLFHVIDDREVWSIFTVLEPGGTFRHLAHVRWLFRYEFKFKWRNGTPVPTSSSAFTVGNPAKGAPSDAELQPVLSALSATQSPIANDKAKSALRTVLVPPNPNRSDNDGWFPNVPADFFT